MSTARHSPEPLPEEDLLNDEGIDFLEIRRKLKTGLSRSLGFGFVCMAITVVAGFFATNWFPQVSEMRVAFAFPGFEKGQYPDGSNFSPDDLRAADVVSAALSRRPLGNVDQTMVRSSIEVAGIVPPSIIKERDRLKSSGQTPSIYIPDEYNITFGLRGSNSLSTANREALLLEVISVYTERFRRTYSELPSQFGKAFESLNGADYFEYELILRQDVQRLRTFLASLSGGEEGTSDRKLPRTAAATFRSRTTNVSFGDLLNQVDYFAQIKLSEVLGLIQSAGLSKERDLALLKMDYRLRVLSEEEQRLTQEESIVRDLMAKADLRSQSYVLGIKSQLNSNKNEAPLLDQGLIDSLVQNDSYNFLVRRALDVGIRAKDMSSRKAELEERRKRLAEFLDKDVSKRDSIRGRVDQALESLKLEYFQLLQTVNLTYEDFSRQQLAGALRIVQPPTSGSLVKRLAQYAAFGALVGFAMGLGISLLVPVKSPVR